MPMSKPAMSQSDTPAVSTTRHVIGGVEMSMDDYASYIQALSYKPFLTKREASELFGIGINRLNELMNQPDCPFIAPGGNSRHKKVHRASLERFMLEHDVYREEV